MQRRAAEYRQKTSCSATRVGSSVAWRILWQGRRLRCLPTLWTGFLHRNVGVGATCSLWKDSFGGDPKFRSDTVVMSYDESWERVVLTQKA